MATRSLVKVTHSAAEWEDAASEIASIARDPAFPVLTPSLVVASFRGIKGANLTLRTRVAQLESLVASLRKQMAESEYLEAGTDPRVLAGIITGGGK